MLSALRAGWYFDRREGNKKSAARKGQAALLLKLALDFELCGGEVVGTSESEQKQTLANYGKLRANPY
jgi:hypothetical protein